MKTKQKKQQQASLLSFFGKNGKKKDEKRRAAEAEAAAAASNDGNDGSSSSSRSPARKQAKRNASPVDHHHHQHDGSNDIVIDIANAPLDPGDEKSASSAEIVAVAAAAPPVARPMMGESDEKSGKEGEGDAGAAALVPPSPPAETVDAPSVASKDIGGSSSDEEEEDDNGDCDSSTASSDNANDGVNAENDNDNDNDDDTNDGKSAYELFRERNIARNQARLQALGLLAGVQNNGDGGGDTKKKRQMKRKKAKNANDNSTTTSVAAASSSLPTRRSSRLRNPSVTGQGTGLEVQHDRNECNKINNDRGEQLMELEGERFTVSPLIEYQMPNSSKNDNNPNGESTATSEGNGSSNESQAGNNKGNATTTTITSRNDIKIETLVPSAIRLVPPSGLNAIYTLQFHPSSWGDDGNFNNDDNHDGTNDGGGSSWLAGAGKAGLIALWDCSRHRDGDKQSSDESGGSERRQRIVEPVLWWKGHGGRWIADARFLPPPTSSSSNNSNSNSSGSACVPSQLLTAGNDGTVCHWDLTSASLRTGAPKLLGRSTGALHSGGIFSMDVHFPVHNGINNNGSGSRSSSSGCGCGAYIVTGSKDKSLAVTTLDRLADEPIWRSNFHGGKVGCVSFSSSPSSMRDPLIGSAGDDGLVAIHDARLNGLRCNGESGSGSGGGNGSGNGVVAKLEDAHAKPHSVVWRPGSDRIFMTAGLDEVIKLWDLRNASSPIAAYHGHVPGTGKRLKRIHRPAFLDNNNNNNAPTLPTMESFILSGGEGSHSVSMYQLPGQGSCATATTAANSGNNNGRGGINDDNGNNLQSVFSRGKLPSDVGDIGSLAVAPGNYSFEKGFFSSLVAAAVEGGEVLMLSPNS